MTTHNLEQSASSTKNRTFLLTAMALVAAVTCVLAPISIPVGPIPISLTNLVIYFSLYILGWKYATLSYIVYLLIGVVGLPVFSGFTGGMGKFFGPTGGYLVGFVPMAILAGIIMARTNKRLIHILAMAGGTLVCYALGTIWFCFQTKSTVAGALSVCVFPFLPFDFLKILAASAIGPVLNSRLKEAGLLPS